MNLDKLNETLCQEIEKLRDGKIDPDRVNAVSRAASQILSGVRAYLAYCRATGTQAKLPFFTSIVKSK